MSDDELPPQLDGPYYDDEPFVSSYNSDDPPPQLDGPFLDENSLPGEEVNIKSLMY